MKYAIEMGSGDVVCIPSFIKIGSDIQRWLEVIHIQTHREQGDHVGLLSFFQKRVG
jgi:hypothetical protein